MTRLGSLSLLFSPPRWLRVRLRAGRARRRREHERHEAWIEDVARRAAAAEVEARSVRAVGRDEVGSLALDAVGPSLRQTHDALAAVLALAQKDFAVREEDRREVAALLAQMEKGRNG